MTTFLLPPRLGVRVDGRHSLTHYRVHPRIILPRPLLWRNPIPPFDPQLQQWLDTEYSAGRLMRPLDALNALRTNLRDFLTRYPIQNNFDCHASGLITAYLGNNGSDAQRPGGILGVHRMHTTQAFTLQNAPTQGAANFTAYGVHMGRSQAGPQWFELPQSGPDIMLTAKLTGCTFVARRVGQVTEVAHLQPEDENGVELHQRMQDAGHRAYGRLRYDLDSRSINVIGVRRGAQWEIYAQKIEKHQLAIRSVTKVFPG